ncbi:MAG: thiolase C-terminal domain-containing protein [Nocardioides sp.]
MRTEPTTAAERDQVNPQAGITDPLREIDCAEIYVPFSWFEPMWIDNLGFTAEGEGWKLTQSGETEIGGTLPINMSGGVLSSNRSVRTCCASRGRRPPGDGRGRPPGRPDETSPRARVRRRLPVLPDMVVGSEKPSA